MAVPSEPVAASETFHGCVVFERVRRPTVGGRRCSPAENSFVAIDRVIAAGRFALLLRRAHDCAPTEVIATDLRNGALRAAGIDLLDTIEEHDGHLSAVIAGCPGVRLRALAEKCAARAEVITPELAWHVVHRTAKLVSAWERAGVEPGDTFVAFDGSLHLFPRMDACTEIEAPSYRGDEVWDAFIAGEDPASLAQLVCGTLPGPFLPAVVDAALRSAGFPVHHRPAPAVPPAVQRLLAAPRTSTDASGPLADLVRKLFPEAYERHRRKYAELGTSLEADGRAREARVLAGSALGP